MWGDLDVRTNALIDKIDEKPIIVIVTGTKLKIFKSKSSIYIRGYKDCITMNSMIVY